MDVLHYRDVSHWDGVVTPAGPIAAKATQGTGYVDPQYAENSRKTRAGGWPFIAYHYVDTSDAVAQARHVLSVVGTKIPVMWDVEKGGGNLAHLLAVHDAAVHLGVHGKLAYLPHWYWESIGRPNLKPLRDRGLLLVSSNYPLRGYTDSGPGWDAYGTMSPTVWQYTSTPHDTNAFRGTVAEFAKLIGVQATPATPAPTVPAAKPVHHVVRGDSMSSIAADWHVSLPALEAANPQAGHPARNYSVIWPGDVIHHP